ncbi:MAG: hypothetical protein OXC60_04045 [Litoreibacter sp.]|nr:hypothetical protein [Litoreibacter sp.]
MDEDNQEIAEAFETLFTLDELCLCGRDPGCPSVRDDLVCALTLRLQYGVTVDGCLETASPAFEALERDLKRRPARQLRAARDEIANTMDHLGELDIDSLLDEETDDDVSETLARLWGEDVSHRMN